MKRRTIVEPILSEEIYKCRRWESGTDKDPTRAEVNRAEEEKKRLSAARKRIVIKEPFDLSPHRTYTHESTLSDESDVEPELSAEEEELLSPPPPQRPKNESENESEKEDSISNDNDDNESDSGASGSSSNSDTGDLGSDTNSEEGSEESEGENDFDSDSSESDLSDTNENESEDEEIDNSNESEDDDNVEDDENDNEEEEEEEIGDNNTIKKEEDDEEDDEEEETHQQAMMPEEDYEKCLKRIADLKGDPEWQSFASPLKPIIECDPLMSRYTDYVECILDLTVIEDNLRNHLYPTAKDFDNDVIQMLRNAITFHTKARTQFMYSLVPHAKKLKASYGPTVPAHKQGKTRRTNTSTTNDAHITAGTSEADTEKHSEDSADGEKAPNGVGAVTFERFRNKLERVPGYKFREIIRSSCPLLCSVVTRNELDRSLVYPAKKVDVDFELLSEEAMEKIYKHSRKFMNMIFALNLDANTDSKPPTNTAPPDPK